MLSIFLAFSYSISGGIKYRMYDDRKGFPCFPVAPPSYVMFAFASERCFTNTFSCFSCFRIPFPGGVKYRMYDIRKFLLILIEFLYFTPPEMGLLSPAGPPSPPPSPGHRIRGQLKHLCQWLLIRVWARMGRVGGSSEV